MNLMYSRQLPQTPPGVDPVLLKVFSSIDATAQPRDIESLLGHSYAEVSDDTLTVLVDGNHKRCALPLVCKRWNVCLSQPSYVWAYLNLGFHELWNVQQVPWRCESTH